MSTAKDPVTGLYMVPAPATTTRSTPTRPASRFCCWTRSAITSLRRVFGDAAASAGQQELSGHAPWNGGRHLPRRARERALRLHGQHIRSGPSDRAVDPGRALPLLARKEWLLHAWPHMEKAIAWIHKQRESTRKAPNGRKMRGFGLMPASSLEDNSDWAQWFSTNSFAWAGYDRAATALADIGHPQATEMRRKADEYLGNCAKRSCAPCARRR